MSRWRRGQKHGSQAAGGDRQRSKGLWLLLYSGSFILALLYGLHLFFPGDSVKTRIENELNTLLPGVVQIEAAQLKFPFHLVLTDLTLPISEGLSLPIVSTLGISPLWASLFSDPGLRLSGRTAGGQMQADIWRSGTAEAHLENITFSAALPQSSLAIEGALRKGEATVSGADLESIDVLIEFSRLGLSGLGTLGFKPDLLNLGSGSARLTGNGKELQIKELQLRGGDIGTTVTGSLLLGKTASTTRLNLNFILLPSANLAPDLSSMLQLLGKPNRDGSIRFRINGGLTAPRLRK